MGFSIVYGALLTKTNRISRIFHSASHSARRPSYISPRSQLIITSVLVSVQFGATLMWVLAAFPAAERVYPQRDEVILKCNVNDSSFLISQVHVNDFPKVIPTTQSLSGVQHAAHIRLHLLRHQDPQGSRELQRGQVHRVHHVHHLHHLAGLHPHLLRDGKLFRGKQSNKQRSHLCQLRISFPLSPFVDHCCQLLCCHFVCCCRLCCVCVPCLTMMEKRESGKDET